MMEGLRQLLALTRVSRARFGLSVSLAALTILFGVGLMATAGYLISRAAERPAILSLEVAIVGVRFFGIGRPIARYLERIASHDVALRALGEIRVRVYRRVEPLAPTQLRGYRQGDLLTRAVADVDSLQDLHLRGIGPPLAGAAAGLVSVGAAAAFLPSAGLILGCGLFLAGIAVPLVSNLLGARAARRQAAARGALATELTQLLQGAPELSLYGVDDRELTRVGKADGQLVRLSDRDAFAGGIGDALGLLVCGLTVSGVLAAAVAAHVGSGLDRVLIATLALLVLASFEAVQPLPEAARRLGATLAAGRRVLELIDRKPNVSDPEDPVPLPPGPVTLALENVRARYCANEALALDGVSVMLEPGQRLALVGPSGAGKTTVVNLLLRFIDPEVGRVTLAGTDLRCYRQADIRSAIAVCGQESHLFSASIYENVRLARPVASDDEIEEALRRAKIWDWVQELDDGWNTVVGEQGRALSEGQRQRIVLARALLADAPVLVLDEPTAHLDSATADELMRDLMAAAWAKSLLLITHRPEGLEFCDEVITLRAGRSSTVRSEG